MIIQNIVSLLYLESFGRWTDNRKEALVFPTMALAHHFYRQHQVLMKLAVLVEIEKE